MHAKAKFALPFLLVLCGCGGSSGSATVSEAPTLVFSTDLTSAFSNIKIYKAGSIRAGWNQLTGTATIDGSSATVELLANVNYVNGSGPFYGFLTYTLSDHSALTLTMTGKAKQDPSTGVTAFTSTLATVGGNVKYVNTTGTGSFTGTRSTALGGAVHLDVKLSLR